MEYHIHFLISKITIWLIGNHTHSRPIREIIVHAIRKIVLGFASYNFLPLLSTIISKIGLECVWLPILIPSLWHLCSLVKLRFHISHLLLVTHRPDWTLTAIICPLKVTREIMVHNSRACLQPYRFFLVKSRIFTHR